MSRLPYISINAHTTQRSSNQRISSDCNNAVGSAQRSRALNQRAARTMPCNAHGGAVRTFCRTGQYVESMLRHSIPTHSHMCTLLDGGVEPWT